MISKECFTTEWIAQKSIELQYNDKNLIEKVIRAFFLAGNGRPRQMEAGHLSGKFAAHDSMGRKGNP
ncbi:MAG: hypothetical protein MR971_08225 [Bacteroidales bacterium]|nr:hypothetical protein [Bacteroidales bacterium]